MNKHDLNSLLQLALTSQKEEHTRLFHKAIYDQFHGIVYAIVKNRFPYQADDIVHDFYCKVILEIKLEKYAKVLDYLEPYLIRVLINFCVDVHHRKEKELRVKDVYAEILNTDTINYQYQPIDQLTNRMWLEFLLDRLSQRQKTAFILRNYYGYAYKEIPEMMNEEITPAAVKQLLIRAKKKLCQYA